MKHFSNIIKNQDWNQVWNSTLALLAVANLQIAMMAQERVELEVGWLGSTLLLLKLLISYLWVEPVEGGNEALRMEKIIKEEGEGERSERRNKEIITLMIITDGLQLLII